MFANTLQFCKFIDGKNLQIYEVYQNLRFERSVLSREFDDETICRVLIKNLYLDQRCEFADFSTRVMLEKNVEF